MNTNIQAFLEWLEVEKRFSAHTITAYRTALFKFNEYLDNQYNLDHIKDVKLIHLRSYLVYLNQAQYAPTSINQHISVLKSYALFIEKIHGVIIYR